MDCLAWIFDRERHMAILVLSVFVLSAGLALLRRRMEWSGAAVLAAFIVSTAILVLDSIRHGLGPLFVLGWGLSIIYGLMIALPTVATIRWVLANIALKT